MEIRIIQPEEVVRYAEMQREAFVMSQESMQRWIEQMYLPERENIYGLFDNKEMVSALAIIFPELWVGAGTVKMPGIAGVATPPEFRRNGYLKILLNHVLNELYLKGYAISTLQPFYFPFYKKFGYEQFSTTKEITVSMSGLAHFRKLATGKGRWKQVYPQNWQELDEIYNQYCQGRFGRLTRTKTWWEVRVFNKWKDDARTAYVWQDAAGRNRAYIIYWFKKLGSDWERELRIRDQAWLDPEAHMEVLAFIANHDSQADKAVWQSEENDELFALLPDPREAEEKIYPGYMLRILDAVRALSERPWHKNASGSFSLALQDNRLPHNDNITVTVNVKNGQAQVTSQNGTANAGLSCDIRQLSQLFAGYRTPKQLAQINLLDVQNPSELEEAQRAFYHPGRRVPFLSDGF